MEPVISFKYYRISKIIYKAVDDIASLSLVDKKEEEQIVLSVGLNEDNTKARLIVRTAFIDEKQLREAEIELTGYFEIPNSTKKEDIERYLTVNGTAILFPYLRAVVSFITSLDNDKAVILPTINTSTFSEAEDH